MVIRNIEELNDSSSGFVYVYADWCKHCTPVKDYVFGLVDKFPDVDFYCLDYDSEEVKSFMDDSGFEGVPTFLVLRDGDVLALFEGVEGEKEDFFAGLEEMLAEEFVGVENG